MPELQTRTAIVTGASRGIGAAIARALTADGWAVAVNYAHGAADAETVATQIRDAGGNALPVKADLSTPDGAGTLFDETETHFGPIGLLVNNAGIMSLSPLAETPDKDFDRQIAINLTGSFRTMREAARRLPDGGRIVNLSSSVVGLYQPGYGAYAAGKAAVEALTKVLAKELGPRRITVNAVAPGPVETALFLDGKPPELVERIRAMNPMGRLGQPEDIAGVVQMLARPESGWINGQIIRANGGVI